MVHFPSLIFLPRNESASDCGLDHVFHACVKLTRPTQMSSAMVSVERRQPAEHSGRRHLSVLCPVQPRRPLPGASGEVVAPERVRWFTKTGRHARLRETVPQQCEQVAGDLQAAYRLPVSPGLQLEFVEAAQRVRDAITVTVFLAKGQGLVASRATLSSAAQPAQTPADAVERVGVQMRFAQRLVPGECCAGVIESLVVIRPAFPRPRRRVVRVRFRREVAELSRWRHGTFEVRQCGREVAKRRVAVADADVGLDERCHVADAFGDLASGGPYGQMVTQRAVASSRRQLKIDDGGQRGSGAGHPPESFGRIDHLPKEGLATVTDGLRERGLIGTDGHFTTTGHATKQRIETLTDQLATPPYDALSPAELDELITELQPITATLVATDSQ